MATASQFCFADYRLDLPNAQLWRGAQVLPLTAKALRVLGLLVAHAGQLVSKDALFQAVWPEAAVSEGVLSNCIGELRQALGDSARAPRFIQTVHRRGYRFLAPVTVPEPAAAAPAVPALPVAPAPPAPPLSSALPPLLVGREAEVTTLRHGLALALRGQRQVVLVSGEAGLGKTTVVDAFLATLAPEPPLWVVWGQCVVHYGTGEAYLPVLDALGRLGRVPGHARLLALLQQYAPTWVGQLPALFPAAEWEAGQRQGLGATRERMLREAAEVLEAMSAEQPLVLVLEDLHWSDHATLDLLTWLARRREPARLLVVGTYRPVEVIVHGHPLQAVHQELALHGQCVDVRLEGLIEEEVTAYLTARFPESAVAPRLARVLHRRTEGQPLFMVQTVDAWVQQGWVAQVAGQWEVQVAVDTVETGVAASVRQMIAQQFDGLCPAEQGVLEAASVVGVAFSAAAVAAGLEIPLEQVEARCEALVRHGQFLQGCGGEAWPDGTVAGRYGFQHALYQQVVYDRLPVGQQMQLHRRIGLREEAGYGAQTSAHAAELALHFARGRDLPRALRYVQQAAENALRRYAYQEAISHFTTGLELLTTLPETPEYTQHALTLHIALGTALLMTKGYTAPEVEQAYTQAYALCQQVGETPELVSVLVGLWGFHIMRPQLHPARELGDTMLRLAQPADDPALAVIAHWALGVPWLWRGAFPAARQHLEEAIARYTPDQHRVMVLRTGRDPGVACRADVALALWLLGYPAQALARLHEALALAHELAHPFSLAWARCLAAAVYQFRRDVPAVHEQAEATVALATEQGFLLWAAYGTSLRGWALAMQGQGKAGIALVRQGIAAWRTTGAALLVPYLCTLLADVCDHLGHPEDGLQALAEAHTLVEQHEERWWEAEVSRLRGVLLLRQAGTLQAEAETCFRQALDVARRQEAKSLELRAAMSLARLLQQQGKRTEAHELLAPIYGWFTEGFDTADVQEAKALLEEPER